MCVHIPTVPDLYYTWTILWKAITYLFKRCVFYSMHSTTITVLCFVCLHAAFILRKGLTCYRYDVALRSIHSECFMTRSVMYCTEGEVTFPRDKIILHKSYNKIQGRKVVTYRVYIKFVRIKYLIRVHVFVWFVLSPGCTTHFRKGVGMW